MFTFGSGISLTTLYRPVAVVVVHAVILVIVLLTLPGWLLLAFDRHGRMVRFLTELRAWSGETLRQISRGR